MSRALREETRWAACYTLLSMSSAAFEGPEKKFELVVAPGTRLRALPEGTWPKIVQAAGACVLSTRYTAELDAYLLSESSLFVWDDRVAMLTCGRTHLVDAALALLELVPREAVAFLAYERKNEHFPERQPSTFVEDARRLAARLPGRAYRFGAEHEHRIMLFWTDAPYTPRADDVTLEVLMHGIDPRWLEAGLGSAGGDLRCRAATLLPGYEIDEHLFEPAGYSLNAVNGDRYYTIHVTPQREGSYASFETNHDYRGDLSTLVEAVSDLFTPEAFDVVSFVPAPSEPPALRLGSGVLRNHVTQELGGYRVSFRHFYRPVTAPGPAQLVSLEPA